MSFCDLCRLSAGNVRRGGIKSLLCALSVCVAICSVSVISGLSTSAQSAVTREIDSAGIDCIALYTDSDGFTFSPAEFPEIFSEVQGVKAAMPLAMQYGTVSLRNKKQSAGILGVNEQLFDVLSIHLLYGRTLQAHDVLTGANVAVIDSQLAVEFYERENIVGKSLLLKSGSAYETYEIIGIVEPQTDGLNRLVGGQIPTVVYTPYTALDNMLGENTADKLAVSCLAGTDEQAVAETIVQRLHSINPDIKFKYENLSGYTEVFKKIVNVLTIFITGIAAISVIVGGIGVMNSMVSSVERRTREIGVYMALGATRKDILKCFLVEAVIVCIAGGLTGGALSAGVLQLVKQILGLNTRVVSILLGAVAGAGVCGILFGIIPAWAACRLNPIDAIRDE